MTLKKNTPLASKKLLNILITAIMIIAIFSPLIHIVQAAPNPPSNFTATTFNRFGINLSWTNNENNNTYIEWNTAQTWNIEDGNFLYNGTNTNYDHGGLDPNTQYFYQAWSFNTTTHNFSTTYEEDNAITDANQIPTQSSESPSNNSVDASITQSTVSVTIADADGDTFDWTIEGNYLTDNSANDDTDGITV